MPENHETLLHWAVIHNDPYAVDTLKEDLTQRHAKNRLGFTPIELAKYLGHYDCLSRLEPIPPKTFLIQTKDDTEAKSYNVKEYESLFDITYLRYLTFAKYKHFQEALAQCPYTLRLSQRTKTNARTRKGRKKTVANKKKATK